MRAYRDLREEARTWAGGICTSGEGDHLSIQNRRVWGEEWRWINAETVRLPDPLVASDILSHMVCEIGPKTRPVRFAAHKLQSDLWSFYVPD